MSSTAQARARTREILPARMIWIFPCENGAAPLLVGSEWEEVPGAISPSPIFEEVPIKTFSITIHYSCGGCGHERMTVEYDLVVSSEMGAGSCLHFFWEAGLVRHPF